uniref:Uncharacterized protein n=1 Tax=Siphoviridae sp. ctBtS10 TaxID=2826190 RepID=A0A8S5QRZ7_9CAUD|nr:MAG TPA: hypothetical protein [Siphoviridae sp. ctBtS10]
MRDNPLYFARKRPQTRSTAFLSLRIPPDPSSRSCAPPCPPPLPFIGCLDATVDGKSFLPAAGFHAFSTRRLWYTDRRKEETIWSIWTRNTSACFTPLRRPLKNWNG